MVKFWHKELSNISTEDIGDGTIIHSHVWIGQKVSIGKNCKVEAFAFIPDGVTLKDDVFIGPHVCFTNDKYPPSHGKGWSTTTVEKGASIGANSTILPGLIIGEKAMVGAGSVVTKSVPPNTTVKGVPAK